MSPTEELQLDWIAADGQESALLNGRVTLAFVPEARVEVEFRRPTNDSIDVALSLTGELASGGSKEQSALRFFVIVHDPRCLSFVLGNGSPSGITPISSHTPLIKIGRDEAQRVLSDGSFSAVGPKDQGFIRVHGPMGTSLEVSLGPWWGGVSTGASCVNIAAADAAPRSGGTYRLRPHLRWIDGCHVSVAASAHLAAK